MGEDIIAETLRPSQCAAMADHQPHMRAQDGKVVGDGLCVRRADADIHKGDASMAVLHKVIGGHLRQFGQGRLARRAVTARCAAAGLNKFVGAAGLHFGAGIVDELVDIALIIGEQDEVLKMLWRGRGVMTDAVERIIRAFSGKQRERHVIAAVENLLAVDDLVIRIDKVGRVEISRQGLALLEGQGGGD